MLRACSLTREEKMQMARRQFLHFAGAATALFASPCLVRAQEQAPKIGLPPPRPARDRLEEALARIADPKGEGARNCLTVYAQAARSAADAADAENACRHNARPARWGDYQHQGLVRCCKRTDARGVQGAR